MSRSPTGLRPRLPLKSGMTNDPRFHPPEVLLLAAVNARFESGLRSPLDEALLQHTAAHQLDDWTKLDERPFDFQTRRVAVLADHPGGRLEIVKLNTDENPAITARYGITSIPTMNVYVKGELVKSITSAKPKPAMVRELADFIG